MKASIKISYDDGFSYSTSENVEELPPGISPALYLWDLFREEIGNAIESHFKINLQEHHEALDQWQKNCELSIELRKITGRDYSAAIDRTRWASRTTQTYLEKQIEKAKHGTELESEEGITE